MAVNPTRDVLGYIINKGSGEIVISHVAFILSQCISHSVHILFLKPPIGLVYNLTFPTVKEKHIQVSRAGHLISLLR